MISLVPFFIFSNFGFFWFVKGVKGQKMVQNYKHFCLFHTVEKPYIIWLSCMVNICKMIVSSSVFFIFSIFWFSGLMGVCVCVCVCMWRWGLGGRWVKWQKMVHNDKKFGLWHSMSQEPDIIWLWFLVHMCKMMILANVLIYWNFDFWGFWRVKGQKMT